MSSDLAEILACERQRVGELRGAIHRLSLQLERLNRLRCNVDDNTGRTFEAAKERVKELDLELRQLRQQQQQLMR